MKRTTRAKLQQGGLYAALLLAVVLVLTLVDWTAVQQQFFNSEGLKHNWGELITTGVRNTAIYTVIAFSGGLVLALLLALMKLSPIFVYRWIATAYIEFFRGLPALIVILAMGFGV